MTLSRKLLGVTVAVAGAIAMSGCTLPRSNYAARSANNAVALHRLEQANISDFEAGILPWGTPRGIAYMRAHPYDSCDLVRGKDGDVLPGWYDLCDMGAGTSGDGLHF